MKVKKQFSDVQHFQPPPSVSFEKLQKNISFKKNGLNKEQESAVKERDASKESILSFYSKAISKTEQDTPSNNKTTTSRLSTNFSSKMGNSSQSGNPVDTPSQRQSHVLPKSNATMRGSFKDEYNSSTQSQSRVKNNSLIENQYTEQSTDIPNGNYINFEVFHTQKGTEIINKNQKSTSAQKLNHLPQGPFDAPPNSACTANTLISQNLKKPLNMNIFQLLQQKQQIVPPQQNLVPQCSPNQQQLLFKQQCSDEILEKQQNGFNNESTQSNHVFASSVGFIPPQKAQQCLKYLGMNSTVLNSSSKYMATKRLLEKSNENSQQDQNDTTKQHYSLQRPAANSKGSNSVATISKASIQVPGKEYIAKRSSNFTPKNEIEIQSKHGFEQYSFLDCAIQAKRAQQQQLLQQQQHSQMDTLSQQLSSQIQLTKPKGSGSHHQEARLQNHPEKNSKNDKQQLESDMILKQYQYYIQKQQSQQPNPQYNYLKVNQNKYVPEDFPNKFFLFPTQRSNLNQQQQSQNTQAHSQQQQKQQSQTYNSQIMLAPYQAHSNQNYSHNMLLSPASHSSVSCQIASQQQEPQILVMKKKPSNKNCKPDKNHQQNQTIKKNGSFQMNNNFQERESFVLKNKQQSSTASSLSKPPSKSIKQNNSFKGKFEDSPSKNFCQKKKERIKNLIASSMRTSTGLLNTTVQNSNQQQQNKKDLSAQKDKNQQLELTLKKDFYHFGSISPPSQNTINKKSQNDLLLPLKNSPLVFQSMNLQKQSEKQTDEFVAESTNLTLPSKTEILDAIQIKKNNFISSEASSNQVIKTEPPLSHLRKQRIETPDYRGFQYYNTSMDQHFRFPNRDDYFCNIFQQHFSSTYQQLLHCKSMEPIDPQHLEQKMIDLPLNPLKTKTVIFDLDETLVHNNQDAESDAESDVMIPITIPTGETIEIGILIRPYAREMLRELNKYYEIMVFTASYGFYAEKVIDYLDPSRELISYVLNRDNCFISEDETHIKDLRILKNRDLKNVVLVDNAACSFCFQISNGIPIIPFYDNKQDRELKYLTDFLIRLYKKDDVRVYLDKTFRLSAYAECYSEEEALEKVYSIYPDDLTVSLHRNENESCGFHSQRGQKDQNSYQQLRKISATYQSDSKRKISVLYKQPQQEPSVQQDNFFSSVIHHHHQVFDDDDFDIDRYEEEEDEVDDQNQEKPIIS